MPTSIDHTILASLSKELNGTLQFDMLHRSIYATDASVYRKIPLAVAYPKGIDDLKCLISFANTHNISLVPRAAGTSLAGQCVGDGIIVDTSKHFTKIIDFNKDEKTITLEPGIIRDDLNRFLAPHGLFFGPNTSTSNRCMMGGMVGNNSSGSTSIRYGVTRDKVIAISGLLSDGSEVRFTQINSSDFTAKMDEESLEGSIYRTLYENLSQPQVQAEIKAQFPKAAIHRRNTGYALDSLLKSELFGGTDPTINLCELLTGSEGTLAFSTTITLSLDDLPPAHSIMIASHFRSVHEALQATLTVMKHHLFTCELMDKVILDCTKNNREQLQNRFFIEGDPEAILLLEIKAATDQEAEKQANDLIASLTKQQMGYHHPKLYDKQISRALELRKAGLGLLGNIVGDKKAVACIEDTAVALDDLPAYIEEFSALMDRYQQQAVYYAHAGAGELHLRPILNLKKAKDVTLFRAITTETAHLVKKYGGSFSGEHGDGIVRAEFIPLMIGEKNYKLVKQIKQVFDPNNIFNRGKIVEPYAMDQNLRYQTERTEPEIKTLQNFSDNQGILRLAEKCNGSGDCRKSVAAGGTMCPSYRATKNEKDTTRARANALREYLTSSNKTNRFDHEELKEVFDLCLSCKACASECPSNVDVATLKSEFLYQYQKSNGRSMRSKLFANNERYNRLGSKVAGLTNRLLATNFSKSLLGIAKERSIPKLAGKTLRSWYAKLEPSQHKKVVYLFCDEFTNYYDVSVGKDALTLLDRLGYKVHLIKHAESGRSAISKGFLDQAKKVANKNITLFKELITEQTPLIGIEPSAILSFRDEYLRLADDPGAAQELAKHVYTIDEFLAREFENDQIDTSVFTDRALTLKIHGHCHQKALSTMQPTFTILNIPRNYSPTLMSTGCCGMAGSFGYEQEHYTLSMQVGEDSLFPKIRNTPADVALVAGGTSCRHQILDGTQRRAKHPISILKEALK